MDIIQRLVTIDEKLLWYLSAKYISPSGNEILIDPDTGIFINGNPIGGGGEIIVDEILLSGLNKSIGMNTTDGLVFTTSPPGETPVINSLGEYGLRLDPTTTIQIGNTTLDYELLKMLNSVNNTATGGLVLDPNATIVLGDQTISRTSLINNRAALDNAIVRLDAVESTVAGLTPLLDIRSDVDVLIFDVNTLKTTVSTHTTDITDLFTNYDTLANAINVISTEQSRIVGDISVLWNAVDVHTNEITNAKSRLDGLDTSVANVSATASSAQNAAQMAQNTAQSAADSVVSFQSEIDDITTIATDASTKATSAETMAIDASTKATSAEAMAIDASTKAVSAENTAMTASTNAANALAIATTANENVDMLSDDLDTANANVTTLTGRVDNIDHEITLLDNRVTNLENSGGPDPVVLPFYVETAKINFGTGKTVITDEAVTIGIASLNEQSIVGSNKVVNMQEKVVDPTYRAVLYSDGALNYSSEPLTTLVNPEWVKPTEAVFGEGTPDETVLGLGMLKMGDNTLDTTGIDTVNKLEAAAPVDFTPGTIVISKDANGYNQTTLPTFLTKTGLDFEGTIFSKTQAETVKKLDTIAEGAGNRVVIYDPPTKTFTHQEKPVWINETTKVIGNMGGTGDQTEAYLHKGGVTFGSTTANDNTALSYTGLNVMDKTTGSVGQRRSALYGPNGISLSNPLVTAIDDPETITLDRQKLALLQRIASVDVISAPDVNPNASQRMLVGDKISGVFSYANIPTSFSYLNTNSILIGTNLMSSAGFKSDGGTLDGNGLSLTGGISLQDSTVISQTDLKKLKTNFVDAPNGTSLSVDPTTRRFLSSYLDGTNSSWMQVPASYEWLKDDEISKLDTGTGASLVINPNSYTFTSLVAGVPSDFRRIKLDKSGIDVLADGGRRSIFDGVSLKISTSQPVTDTLFPENSYYIDRRGIGLVHVLLDSVNNVPTSTIPYFVTGIFNGGAVSYRKISVYDMIPGSVIQPLRNPTAVKAAHLALNGISPKPAVLDAAGLSFPSANILIGNTSTQAPHDDTTYNSNFARIGKAATGKGSLLTATTLQLNEDSLNRVELTTGGLRIKSTAGDTTMSITPNGVDISTAANKKMAIASDATVGTFAVGLATVVRSVPTNVMLNGRYTYYNNSTTQVYGTGVPVTKPRFVRTAGAGNTYLSFDYISEAFSTSVCLDFSTVGQIAFSYPSGNIRPFSVGEVGFVTSGQPSPFYNITMEQQANSTAGGTFMIVPYSSYTGSEGYSINSGGGSTLVFSSGNYWVCSAKIMFFPDTTSAGSSTFNGKVRFQIIT